MSGMDPYIASQCRRAIKAVLDCIEGEAVGVRLGEFTSGVATAEYEALLARVRALRQRVVGNDSYRGHFDLTCSALHPHDRRFCCTLPKDHPSPHFARHGSETHEWRTSKRRTRKQTCTPESAVQT